MLGKDALGPQHSTATILVTSETPPILGQAINFLIGSALLE